MVFGIEAGIPKTSIESFSGSGIRSRIASSQELFGPGRVNSHNSLDSDNLTGSRLHTDQAAVCSGGLARTIDS